MAYRILVLNLGSTSTKIAIYLDEQEKLKETIFHSQDELKKFETVWDQKDFRKEKILAVLGENGYKISDFDGIACRGGNMKPVEGGIYIITEEILADIRSEKYGVHPTGVGNIIAFEMGKEAGIPVLTADPPITDELCALARYSGIKELPRISSFHALNQKRVAKKVAEMLGKIYEELRLIVVHLGGGISVAAHEYGRVIDVNNALDGDGPFSPERAGSLPVGELIKMCFSGKYTEKEMLKKVNGRGGLVSYLDTNDARDVEEMIKKGDKHALEVYEAMAYQVSKEMGAMAAVLKGKVDAIVLTGGLANSEWLTNWIKERTGFIAPVYLMPGENEMLSLAENAFRYLAGEEKAKKY